MSKTLNIPCDVSARGPSCEVFYRRLVAKGESPRMAEMLATRRAPNCITDDTIFRGQKTGDQFAKDHPFVGEHYARELRAMGGSPAGKVYKHSLARYAGDPEAWVSSAADIKAVCRKRGWESDGMVKVKRNKDCLDNGDHGEPYMVAEDIIQSEAQLTLSQNPDLAPTPKERERFIEDLREKRRPARARGKFASPKKAKKPRLISLGTK